MQRQPLRGCLFAANRLRCPAAYQAKPGNTGGSSNCCPDTAALPRPTQAADRPEQLETVAVGDSIGPRPLEAGRVGTAQLRAGLAEEYTTADTIEGYFLVVKPLSETPRLLYRASRHDTVWTELDGLLRRYGHGDEQKDVQIQQANLDGRGRPLSSEIHLLYFFGPIQ